MSVMRVIIVNVLLVTAVSSACLSITQLSCEALQSAVYIVNKKGQSTVLWGGSCFDDHGRTSEIRAQRDNKQIEFELESKFCLYRPRAVSKIGQETEY